MEPPSRPVKAIRLEDHHADGSHRVVIRSDKGDVVLTQKKPWQVNVKNKNHSATASFAVLIDEENFESSDAFWSDACPDFLHDVSYLGQFLALDFIALCIARGESDRLGGHEFELEWMTFKNVATSKLLGFPSTGSGFHGWTRSDTEKAFRIAANIQGPDSDEGDCHYKPQLDVKRQDEESNESKPVDTKVNIKRKVDVIDEEDPEEKNAAPTLAGAIHLSNHVPIANSDMDELKKGLDWQQVSYRGKLLDRQKVVYSLVKSDYQDFDARHVGKMPKIIEKYRVICQKEEKTGELNHCVATLLPKLSHTITPRQETLESLEEHSNVYFITFGAECTIELVHTPSSRKEFLLKVGDVLILAQSILGQAKVGIRGRPLPGDLGNKPRIVLAFRSVKQVGKK